MAQYRIKLYKRGDQIADDKKKRKLAREYTLTANLTHHIYMTDMGKEGATHYDEHSRRLMLAKQISASSQGKISVDAAVKMLRKAHEVQKKADETRAAKFASNKKAKGNNQRNRNNNYRRNNNSSNYRRSSNNRNNSSRNDSRAASASASSSRRPRSGQR